MNVITATSRLARELRQEYDREQEAAALSSWPTAPILPLPEWLSKLWTDWLFSGQAETTDRLLRPAAERVIWEDIIRSGAEDQLLDVPHYRRVGPCFLESSVCLESTVRRYGVERFRGLRGLPVVGQGVPSPLSRERVVIGR